MRFRPRLRYSVSRSPGWRYSMRESVWLGLMAVVVLSFGCGDYWDWLFPEQGCDEVYDPCTDSYREVCDGERLAVVDSDGRCGRACNCTTEIDPVCNRAGDRFRNPCVARCEGAGRVAPCGDRPGRGGGDGDCACPRIWDPVCDRRGNEYPNACAARCEGVWPVGPCDDAPGDPGDPPPTGDECVCPDIWAPVCDARGNQYDNRCWAACAGVTDFDDCPPSR